MSLKIESRGMPAGPTPHRSTPLLRRSLRESLREWRRWGSAVLALTLIVCVYRFWAPVNPTTVALTLLLLILALARWGLRYAVATSVAAAACYNFFFLPPVGTFTIADPQNWLTLFAFLATSVFGSRLAEQARGEAEQARTRQGELEVLYRLSRELLQAEDVGSLLDTIAPAVARAASAGAVAVLTVDGRRVGMVDELQAVLEEGEQLLAAPDPFTEQIAKDTWAVPLRVGVRPRGMLLLRGVAVSIETLDALGGLVSVAMDRAQALEEVTRTRAAQESERMRNVMIDAVTHELRTPLTAIKAAATALLSVHAANAIQLPQEDTRELLLVIDEEADRLNRLVARTVEVTRLKAHDAQMTFAPAAPQEIARIALEESDAALGRHHVEVSVSPELPRLWADADYLAKVLSNLLENAAKYSRSGTTILLDAVLAGPSLVFSVRDQGSGIDASEIGLIFDRFYRAKRESDTVPGTGMGLAISRAIAEAHGGTLEVESTLGLGSVFRLALPLPGGLPV